MIRRYAFYLLIAATMCLPFIGTVRAEPEDADGGARFTQDDRDELFLCIEGCRNQFDVDIAMCLELSGDRFNLPFWLVCRSSAGIAYSSCVDLCSNGVNVHPESRPVVPSAESVRGLRE